MTWKCVVCEQENFNSHYPYCQHCQAFTEGKVNENGKNNRENYL